ncbi:MAG: carboxymuconolactone decarboxylase family protein, partial [Acidobacteriota bacterium]|nr:carboxymuconolactone decarboxylase family protein [Acidobacteriota bacterium]
MPQTIPAGRLQLSELATRQYGAMSRLSSTLELDHTLRNLIDVRASQINGCAFCLDMH